MYNENTSATLERLIGFYGNMQLEYPNDYGEIITRNKNYIIYLPYY